VAEDLFRPRVAASNALQDVGTATASGTNTSRFAADDHVHRGVGGLDVNGIASSFYGQVQLSAGNLMSIATAGASTAGSLQLVNLLSSSAIAQAIESASSQGSLASRFALADHRHQGVGGMDVNGVASTFYGTVQLSAGNLMSLVTGGGTNRGTVQFANLLSSSAIAQAVQSVSSPGTLASRFALADHQHQGVGGMDVNGVASTFYGTVQVSAGNLMSIVTGGGTDRGSIQFVNVLSSSAIAQPVASVSSQGSLASRFALADHQHAGIGSVSVVGNTAGAVTAGAGSLVLAGGPNITLSGATAAGGMTISVSASGGTTISGYENMPMLNAATTTFAPGIGTHYFQPFVLQHHLASGRLNAILASYSNSNAGILRLSNGSSFATNTTGTRALTQFNAYSAALYSRGAGGNSTRIESFWSNSWGMSLTQSVSVALTNATNVTAAFSNTMSYVQAVGSDGAYTLTTAGNNGAASSASASMATSAFTSAMSSMINMISGQFLAPIGFNTSIPPGHYWLAIGYSTSQTSSGSSNPDVFPLVNHQMMYGLSSMPHRLFGLTVSNTSSQYFQGAGIYSAVSNAPPATVDFTEIRSVASHLSRYFNINNISVTV
jgi:hypothetical protein